MHEGGTMQKDGSLKDRCIGPASIWQENKQNERGKEL